MGQCPRKGDPLGKGQLGPVVPHMGRAKDGKLEACDHYWLEKNIINGV